MKDVKPGLSPEEYAACDGTALADMIARRSAIGTRAPPTRTAVYAGNLPSTRLAASRSAPWSGDSSSQVTRCRAHWPCSDSAVPSANTQVPPCQSV